MIWAEEAAVADIDRRTLVCTDHRQRGERGRAGTHERRWRTAAAIDAGHSADVCQCGEAGEFYRDRAPACA